jgi:Tol biopolymer transport system component
MRFLLLALTLSLAIEIAVSGQGQQKPHSNMFPQWSSDSKRIEFTSDRDGDPEIYTMNADGSQQVRLTGNNILDSPKNLGHTSPHGKRIPQDIDGGG